jgi:aminomethyltransferase
MVDWQRIGEFHGSAELVPPTAETAKLVALAAEAGVHVEVGAAVTAGGVEIGTVVAQAPSANPAEELVFALVESPFWVPGLGLEVVDTDGAARPAATTTAPRVIARSLHERIG